MKLTQSNRDLELAFQTGYRCGLGKEEQFRFPNCDKAFNDCWPFLKDAAKGGGWTLSSKDAVEREFRRGWGKGVSQRGPKRAAQSNASLTGNEDLSLAHKLGYHCALGEEDQFKFPNVEKAWNEYWPLIRDEVRIRKWLAHARDEVEMAFRRGYDDGLYSKQPGIITGSKWS